MEPVTFSLVMAWLLLRYGVGDAVAAWRGSESPRTVDRAARQNIDRERRAAGLGPTVGQAVRGRLAQRIANPPPRPDREPGPFRTWLAEWWDDAWAGATERRIARRQARHAEQLRREQEAERRRRGEDELWTRRQRRDPDPDLEREPADDPDVIDAEVVDTDDEPPAPEPDPAPEPIDMTKPDQPDQPEQHDQPDQPDTAPKESSVPNIDMNGETIDPTSASAFATNCKAVADQLLVAIEQSIALLTERGVAGAPLEHFEQMRESFTIASQAAEAANGYFEGHINTQDQIGSDDTIAGTVEGTYLDKAAS